MSTAATTTTTTSSKKKTTKCPVPSFQLTRCALQQQQAPIATTTTTTTATTTKPTTAPSLSSSSSSNSVGTKKATKTKSSPRTAATKTTTPQLQQPDAAIELCPDAKLSVGSIVNISSTAVGSSLVTTLPPPSTTATTTPVETKSKPAKGGGKTKTTTTSAKPSQEVLALHRKWQEQAVALGGKDARLVVSKPEAKRLIFQLLQEAFRPMNITQIHKVSHKSGACCCGCSC